MDSTQPFTSVRSPIVLIEQPSKHGKFWAAQLGGLSWEHITQATKQLRTEHAPVAKPLSDEPTLKTSALHKAFAQALGVTNQHEWQNTVKEKLPAFLTKHGLTMPADLITPPTIAKRMMVNFDARELADRIFNSSNPPPQRIYTGVDGRLFRFLPVHSFFIIQLENAVLGDESKLADFSLEKSMAIIGEYGDQKVFAEPGFEYEFIEPVENGGELQITTEELLQLTWRDVLLAGGILHNTAGTMLDQLATRHRLLCDGVIGPLQDEAAIHGGSPKLFSILHQALIDDVDGWVDVIPFNQNLCFLKGKGGKFDWLVRAQRDEMLSTNPLHPIVDAKELPSEQKHSFKVWYYYQTTRSFHDDHLAAWEWQHQHGSLFKGEREPLNIIEYYLRDAGIYRVFGRSHTAPTAQFNQPLFYSHRVGAVPMQVSELITAEQFQAFIDAEDWLEKRASRANKANIRLDAIEPQIVDRDFPAGVTFYDAMAYCGWLEKQMGVPVRLLSPLEWKAILPTQLTERYAARERNKLSFAEEVNMLAERKKQVGKRPINRVVACEYDGELMDIEDLPRLSEASYQAVPVRFIHEKVAWITNEAGLPFLDGRGFGEWLDNLYSGHAPAVCAAYGRTMQDGELNTADHAIYSTYKHHGQKIGFRVCYTQKLDS